MAGFTTVRALGGSDVHVALRNAVNQGLVEGRQRRNIGHEYKNRVMTLKIPAEFLLLQS
jgi:hypothetical protein